MGYCTYAVRASDGLAVAAWIGTGTDAGKQKTVTYTYSGCTNSKPGQSSFQRCKDLRCADARRQFCQLHGTVHCSNNVKKCLGEKCPCGIKAYQCTGTTILDATNCKCVPRAVGTCQNNCWTGQTSSGPKTVCSYDCTKARARFCEIHGKPCPGGRKCYSASGADPCPSAGPGGGTGGNIVPPIPIADDFIGVIMKTFGFSRDAAYGFLAIGAIALIFLIKK